MSLEGMLERVIGVERPQLLSERLTGASEWDFAIHIAPRDLRRLNGAKFFRRDGMRPDVFADLICDRVATIDNQSDAFDWFLNTALAVLDERRDIRDRVERWEDQQQPAPTRRLPDVQTSIIGLGQRQIVLIDAMGDVWQSAADLVRATDAERYVSSTTAQRREMVRAVKRNLIVIAHRGIVEVETVSGQLSARFTQ
jgi:hypothetical protein